MYKLLAFISVDMTFKQVFGFAGFMKPEYGTPIFCANFFTSTNMNIVVL